MVYGEEEVECTECGEIGSESEIRDHILVEHSVGGYWKTKAEARSFTCPLCGTRLDELNIEPKFCPECGLSLMDKKLGRGITTYENYEHLLNETHLLGWGLDLENVRLAWSRTMDYKKFKNDEKPIESVDRKFNFGLYRRDTPHEWSKDLPELLSYFIDIEVVEEKLDDDFEPDDHGWKRINFDEYLEHYEEYYHPSE